MAQYSEVAAQDRKNRPENPEIFSNLNRILTLGCYHILCRLEVRKGMRKGDDADMGRSRKATILTLSGARFPGGDEYGAVLDTIFAAVLACFPVFARQGGGA